MIARLGAKTRYDAVAKGTEWEGLPQETDNPIPLVLPHGAQICATGLVLRREIDVKQWGDLGKELVRINSGFQWACGDWWVHGDTKKYGRRVDIAKTLPFEFETLMNWGSIALKVAPSRRNEALSFSHHAVIASADDHEQTKWLTRAAKHNWSVRELRDKYNNRPGLADFSGLPAGLSPSDGQLLRAARDAQAADMLDWNRPMDEKVLGLLIEASLRVVRTWTKIGDDLQARSDRKEQEPRERLDRPIRAAAQ